MKFKNDPIGLAIHDFSKNPDPSKNITIESDLCEDDILPVAYLFRKCDQMPELEKVALNHCKGKILDIGSGAGCHALYLLNNGFDVLCLENSKGAASFLASSDIPVVHKDFNQFDEGSFDSILMLMNGIGLAGTLDNLPLVLSHLKGLLNPGGRLIVDSTDIIYMYENEDGSLWMDLAASYYGEMQFNMIYNEVESGWFPWLYIDPIKFEEISSAVGFQFEILFEGDNNHYLASLKKM